MFIRIKGLELDVFNLISLCTIDCEGVDYSKVQWYDS